MVAKILKTCLYMCVYIYICMCIYFFIYSFIYLFVNLFVYLLYIGSEPTFLRRTASPKEAQAQKQQFHRHSPNQSGSKTLKP